MTMSITLSRDQHRALVLYMAHHFSATDMKDYESAREKIRVSYLKKYGPIYNFKG